MSAEALKKNVPIAISFDKNGNLAEAAIANVAIVDKNGVLRYPSLESILPGTTLLAAIRLAGARLPVAEGPVSREDLKTAREILLFTSATLCVAITSYDGCPVGHGASAGKPGEIALWLKDALLEYMLEHGTPFNRGAYGR